MSKFSNFKIKWPKSVEKLENGGRLGPLRQDLPPKNDPLDSPLFVPVCLCKPYMVSTGCTTALSRVISESKCRFV